MPPHSLPSLSALPGSGPSHSGHPSSARSHNPVVCMTLVRIRRLCFPHIRIPCQLSWSLTDSCGCPDSAGPACPCASYACAFSRWRDSPHLLFSACPHSERAHCVCAPCGCAVSARSQCACREMRLFAVRSLPVLQTGGVRMCEGPSGRPQKVSSSNPTSSILCPSLLFNHSAMRVDAEESFFFSSCAPRLRTFLDCVDCLHCGPSSAADVRSRSAPCPNIFLVAIIRTGGADVGRFGSP